MRSCVIWGKKRALTATNTAAAAIIITVLHLGQWGSGWTRVAWYTEEMKIMKRVSLNTARVNMLILRFV